MLKAAGHEVTRLKRIAFGAIELGDLAPGKWRDISADGNPRGVSRAPSTRQAEAHLPAPAAPIAPDRTYAPLLLLLLLLLRLIERVRGSALPAQPRSSSA